MCHYAMICCLFFDASCQIFADAAEKTQHIGQFVGLVLAESFEARMLKQSESDTNSLEQFLKATLDPLDWSIGQSINRSIPF